MNEENYEVIIQGITGEEGSKATRQMLRYGTKLVCGVTPGKGGQKIEGLNVYNSVSEAKKEFPNINFTVIYVPPKRVKSAALEAIENKIKNILCITENVPIHDIAEIITLSKKNSINLIGPSSIGYIDTNRRYKLGSIGGENNDSYISGDIGIISKSGGMCSETANLLKQKGYGVSKVIGIGGDLISGFDFCDGLKLLEKDKYTKIIILYGEIGGEYEQKAAEFISKNKITKPVIAYVSGKFAEQLPFTTLGHAGAIIEGKNTTREEKIKVLKKNGITVVNIHHQIVDAIEKIKNGLED